MASWVSTVPVSTTIPCVVVTPMSTPLPMLSAANWDFTSVVITPSNAASSSLLGASWASMAVPLAADGIICSRALFTPSTLFLSRVSVVSALLCALAECRLLATLGSTAAGLAASPDLAPTLSLLVIATGASGIGATAAGASGIGATAAGASAIGATAAEGWAIWGTEGEWWERSATVPAMTASTTAMPLATRILRANSGFMFGYSVGLANRRFLPGQRGSRRGETNTRESKRHLESRLMGCLARLATTFSHADVSPVPESRDRGAPAHRRDADRARARIAS